MALPSNLHKVFVYGTLKRGEPNHDWFEKAEGGSYRFLGKAETIEKYPLVIATKYNIPFLLYSPGNGHNVEGELYEVDDKVLANLDVLEDHPDFYVREVHDFKVDGAPDPVRAWVYFIKKFNPDLLQRDFYRSYSDSSAHGLRYVVSEESTIDDLNGPA